MSIETIDRYLASHFSLAKQVIVITGGAGFLGSQFVHALYQAGATPIVLDNHAEKLHQLEKTFLKQQDATLVTYQVDITCQQAVRDVSQAIWERFGRIDTLINNAANNPVVNQDQHFHKNYLFEDMSTDFWYGDLAVGLTGAFYCSQVFGALMAKQGHGLILNISSDLGLISPDQRLYETPEQDSPYRQVKPVTYSVVKTGIIGLTRYLATYWCKEGVRSNALAFGGVFNDQPSHFLEKVSERIPLGRLAAAKEYLGPLIFMCSQSASYMNGATVVLDGGRTIW